MSEPRKKSSKHDSAKGDKSADKRLELPTVIKDALDDTKRLMGRPTDYTPEAGATVIRLMSEGLSLTAAAGAMGFARQTLYDWKKRHPDFLDSVNRAKAARVFRLESEMLASESGAYVNARRFALVNAAPEEWREKQTVNLDTEKDSPLAELARALAGTALRPKESSSTAAIYSEQEE